ncbi:16S rRNA (uracil(1498)-N(3))-methyltransferase [Nesterenkonia sp. HG001]|uniref:16S rRNA (uracil(1498)-N(3))-methyltransferase n=1 Tax=Nesterenkonia sp. HG001 TaxID=2983207 RepID=UPI002AC45661|nr:16S rRNA (uracil(1498)-N(3))-methyltransferase [Nesterenkonia sp. HG001]MDZ5077959.1 16S rRNA (uracil(1498)-N(3))-methyltransferase [Nesterenkonia sp. HG001]
MTAPLFHLEPGQLDGVEVGGQVVLDGAEGHHAATVMRLSPGAEIQLSDTRRLRVTGEVVEAARGELTVAVSEVRREPLERPRLVLVQALAKDRRDLQAVESATELGIEAVVPWEAERSVARWKAGREAKKHAEWVSIVRTAAKQTRRTAVPEVEQLHTTAQYCRRIVEQKGVAVVVLHETEERSLDGALRELDAVDAEELHLVVGPEGGITPGEIERLVSAGARVARLGRTVLRSSTAGPAALAGVQVLLGRWSGPGSPEAGASGPARRQ